MASQTGYSDTELLKLLKNRYPDFRSQNRGWYHEIDKLTIGSAIFILTTLFNEVLPEKKAEIERFLETLDQLRIKFNNLSHNPPEGATSDLVSGILTILNFTKELISEMPWHFYPIQKNGHQPMVLTGNAWSHSYKEDKQLSVILWNNDNNSENLMIWNPSKVNPVIPDGKIINRPRN